MEERAGGGESGWRRERVEERAGGGESGWRRERVEERAGGGESGWRRATSTVRRHLIYQILYTYIISSFLFDDFYV